MTELEHLRIQIEELRLNMITAKTDNAYTSLEVLAASQELDQVLNQYYSKLTYMKKPYQEFDIPLHNQVV